MKKLLLILLFLFFSLNTSSSYAQSGCCSWHGGESYCSASGRWVCGDGSFSPSCTCGYVPPPIYVPPIYIPPPIVPFPKNMSVEANWNYTATPNGTYDITFRFSNPNNLNVSISLNPVEWANPGPYSDTNSSTWTFKDIQPNSTQYVNMKAMLNGSWSQIEAWTIQVPAWVAPTPEITTSQTIIDPSPINHKSFINSIFDWISGFFKKADETTDSSNLNSNEQQYACDCSKTCSQISSCTEAYYQLNNCGCSVRDGDGDGVPCENLCR